MQINRLITYVFLTCLLCITYACNHDADVPSEPAVSFNNDIKIILSANCMQSGCHGNVNTERFSLATYDELMSAGIVSAGDARNSGIYRAITGRSGIMPPSPQPILTERQIGLIYIWIEQGAKNN